MAEAARAARAKLGPSPCDLALVFVSQAWDDFDPAELSPILAKELAPLHSLGRNASGAIAGRREVEMKPGVAVLAMRLPGVKLHSFSLAPSELKRLEDGKSLVALLDLYPTDQPKFLAFGDPMSCDVDHLTSLFNEGYPGAPLVGGMSSGPQLKRPSWMLLNGEVIENGVAGMALTGDVTFDIVVAQGCRPIGEPLIVTKAEGNLLQELGGRSPLEVLRETLAKCPPEDQRLARHALFAGLVMKEGHSGYKRGDFVIRNLMGFDQETGALVLGTNLRRGQTLQFQLATRRRRTPISSSCWAGCRRAWLPRGALLVNAGAGRGCTASRITTRRSCSPCAGLCRWRGSSPTGSLGRWAGATTSTAIRRASSLSGEEGRGAGAAAQTAGLEIIFERQGHPA